MNSRNILIIIGGLIGLCVCGVVCVSGTIIALGMLPQPGANTLPTSTPTPAISAATDTATPGISISRATPTPAINLPRSSPTPAINLPRTTPTISISRNTPAASGGSTQVIFTDDFSGSCKLAEGDSDKRTYKCENGGYTMLNKTGTARWVYYNDEYSDLVMEADARVVSGPAFIEYGLIFRVSSDGKSYYGVTLTRDGKYTIWRCDDPCVDGTDFVDLIPYTTAPAVKTGTTSNRIKVVMQGNQIAAYVNDTWVNTVTDDFYGSGTVGFFINNKDPNSQVAFKNLKISQINGKLTLPKGVPVPTPTP